MSVHAQPIAGDALKAIHLAHGRDDSIHIQETFKMVKLVVGFIVFAAVSLFVIMKAGDKVDMSGEKHGTEMATPAAEGASH